MTANGDADGDTDGDDDDDDDDGDDDNDDDDDFVLRGGRAGGGASTCGRGATATDNNCAPARAVKVAAAWWAASPFPRKNGAPLKKTPLLMRDRRGRSPLLLRDRQRQATIVARRCATARGRSPPLRDRQGQVTARL